MHVPDGQKNTNARSRAAGVFFAGDNHDLSIRWRDDRSRIGGDDAFGVAEERKTEEREGHQ